MMHRRTRALFLMMCLVMAVFAGQLLRIQALDAAALADEALGSRMTTEAIPAWRGQIVDRSGVVFAHSVDRYHITVDQKVIPEAYRYVRDSRTGKRVRQVLGVEAVAQELSQTLSLDVATVRERITGTRRFVYLAKDVTPEVWRAVKKLNIGGVYGEQTSQRQYPADGVGASVVGFMGQAGTPLGGLELRLNEQLAGRPGLISYQADPSGRSISTSEAVEDPAQSGQDIRLTLDRDLQWRTEELLAAQVQKSRAISGTAIVLSVHDGKVLALANAPTFDPNVPSQAKPENLSNRALSEIYEPGSTSKVMTAAAAIEEGVVAASTSLTVPDHITRSGSAFHDSSPHATEQWTFAEVLAKSSNVGTILAGERMTPETTYSYLKKFGLGEFSQLRFPGESRGILAQPEDWSGSQRYTVMFGQGLSVNALQAASVFQTIANDGVRKEPSFIEGTTKLNGEFNPAKPTSSTRVVSAKTAQAVRAMLEGAVSDEGTAPQARIPGYRVAGKTGTAERFDSACGCYRGYTASFIGMAPADDPELVVAVTLQGPTRGRYGGELAAPVFQDIMSYALQKFRIPPTSQRPPVVAKSLTER
ncbi:MAG: peptidoglycan D,D-transpeptidase FtsI family protein [Actinomycetota bacterium]